MGNFFTKRRALTSNVKNRLNECIDYYIESGEDLPYYGRFQREFEAKLCEYFRLNEGNAIAVSSGTAACFIVFQYIKRKKPNAVVAISPVADAGLVSALMILDLKFVILDSEVSSFNCSFQSLIEQNSLLNQDLTALFLVHAAGYAHSKLTQIRNYCITKGILVVEDISQCVGAVDASGEKVGAIGDFGVCSTMYRKGLFTGTQGGFIITRSPEHSAGLRSLADRGKQEISPEASRFQSTYSGPALNWCTSELSCAIGIESLNVLDDVNRRRRDVAQHLVEMLKDLLEYGAFLHYTERDAPFTLLFFLDNPAQKSYVCDFLEERGVPHNGAYDQLPEMWPWVENSKCDDYVSSLIRRNAPSLRSRCVAIYLNENYGFTDSVSGGFVR